MATGTVGRGCGELEAQETAGRLGMAELGEEVHGRAGPGTAGLGIPEGAHGPAGLDGSPAGGPDGGWETVPLPAPLCLC